MVDGRVEEMKNSIDIFYAINVIRNVQHSKTTKVEVCGVFEKLNKNIDMSILEENFDKLEENLLIEAKGEDGQRSYFTNKPLREFVGLLADEPRISSNA